MKSLDIQTDPEIFLTDHSRGLHSGRSRSSIPGGQTTADQALTELNIAGYANNRSAVLPLTARGATVLSPYIRHNLPTLEKVWNRVAKAPYTDQEKCRDELLWQEYSRHRYAQLGARLFHNLWLKRPLGQSVKSFSAWRGKLR